MSRIADINLGALSAGASGTVATTVTAPMSPGIYTVVARAPTADLKASTENNTTTATLGVADSRTAMPTGSPSRTDNCNYYASPRGTGDGASSLTPFRMTNFWAVATPGKTLCLLDGTYQGDANMISPRPGRSGISGSPITIRALNDGGAVIDGQFQRQPVFLKGNSWWVFEGFDAKSSSAEVIAVTSGSANNIFRRIVAWDASISKNTHVISVFEAGSNNNLFEDVAAFGTGRKVCNSSQGPQGTTFRRVWCRWEGSIGSAPKNTMQFSYSASGEICENCLLTFNAISMPTTYCVNDIGTYPTCSGSTAMSGGAINTTDAFLDIAPTSGTGGCKNVKVHGTLAYTKADDVLGGTTQQFWNISASCVDFKDTMSFISPSNASFNNIGGFLLNTGVTTENLTATNITSVRSSSFRNISDGVTPDRFASGWFVTGFSAGTSIGAVPSPWTATSTGANLCYRYVNGVRTTAPLWPWPMNDRIKAATGGAGAYAGPCKSCVGGRRLRTPTDVQADIEASLGTIPASCRQ
jgi:hypothetical protein